MRHDLEEFLAAGGFRTGARQTALYLRELFPIKAALSDEGVVQPKVPNDSDSAPLPIILGNEGSPQIGAAYGAVGAVPTAPSGTGLAAGAGAGSGGSPYPAGMTVLTQVSTQSARSRDADSDPPLVIPRGMSNAKLALVAAALTFVAITTAILFLRSRRPDDAVASPAPENVEPAPQPTGEPAPRAPAAPAAKVPTTEATEPEHKPERIAEAPPARAESPPSVIRVSTPPASSHVAVPPHGPSFSSDRARNRRQRRQMASSESSSRESSSRSVPAPTSAPAPPPPPAPPVAEAPRPAPQTSEPPARPAVRPTPASDPATASVSRPVPAAPPSGFIDSKAVTAVVRAHSAEVQGCFDRSLMERSDLHGRLTVRASVDPNGHVLGVTPVAVMQGGGRLQACVVEAFGHWTFPPPSGGVKGTVTYSFSFE